MRSGPLPASGCSSGSSAANGSSPRSTRSAPSCSRRGAAASWKQTATCTPPERTRSTSSSVVALGDVGLDLGALGDQPGQRPGHVRGERARERADAQLAGGVPGQLGELPAGEVQPVGDDVGVLEQQRARGRERQPAGAALEQLRARLALERRDLLRDRGLGQRQGLGRAREGAEPRDLAESQHAARVDHRLSL